MIGDWAGEFGGMQFTASDYLKNAVDFDGDGRRDLIKSVPDTLASGRQFPRQHSAGGAASRGCRKCACRRTCRGRRPTSPSSIRVSQWVAWGVKPAHGTLPRRNLEASLILPMGRHGPAFLAYPNFKAFLGWNSAYVYSTTVAYFATRLDGAPAVDHEGAKQSPCRCRPSR